MIRIDALWLAVEPMDLRRRHRATAGQRRAGVRQGPGPPRLPVRQRACHAHQAVPTPPLRRVDRGVTTERWALRMAARGGRRQSCSISADDPDAAAVRRPGAGPAVAALDANAGHHAHVIHQHDGGGSHPTLHGPCRAIGAGSNGPDAGDWAHCAHARCAQLQSPEAARFEP